jgi:hypothetical protein
VTQKGNEGQFVMRFGIRRIQCNSIHAVGKGHSVSWENGAGSREKVAGSREQGAVVAYTVIYNQDSRLYQAK